MVELAKVFKSFKKENTKIEILKNINLKVKDGEIISIFGPNGSGKTTLLKIIAGIEKHDSGEIKRGKDAKIGFVWQNYSESLFPWYNAKKNILIGLNEKQNDYEIEKQLDKFSEMLDFNFSLKDYPYKLSGGQQQLIAIARSLMTKPNILFLDEPFSALDVKRREKILKNLRIHCNNNKITTFFISHDLDESILFADTLILLSEIPAQVTLKVNICFDKVRDKFLILEEKFSEYRNYVIKNLLK